MKRRWRIYKPSRITVKRTLIMLALCCSSDQTFAQGTLVFANLASGVNTPITYPSNSVCVPLTNPSYLADLYWSNTTNAPSDSLTAAGFNVPFSTITAGGGGYFLGGTRTVAGATGAIEAQVRVWNSQFGSTYEAARAAGGLIGASVPVVMILAIPPAPAPPLAGLQGFTLCIPEPSSFALAALAVVLIFHHRRLRSAERRN
jgi:hypothetical protein